MAQQRKRKAGEAEGAGANGHHHTQPTRQEIEAGASSSPAGNGTQAHQLYASIATLAYELYERRGRADGFDLEDWLKAEELITTQAGSGRGL